MAYASPGAGMTQAWRDWQDRQAGSFGTFTQPDGSQIGGNNQWSTYLTNNQDVMDHWTSNTDNVQKNYPTPEAWAQDHYRRYGQAEGRALSSTPAGTIGGTTPSLSLADKWNNVEVSAPTFQQPLVDSMVQRVGTDAANQNALSKQLYGLLSQRATQNIVPTRDDPTVRAQADAYSANETRAMRDYLGDVAEREGPNANIRGEQRMAAERLGQRTGAFEAELLGRELAARREEVAAALQGWTGLITADQQRALQREMSLLDQAIAQQQLGGDNAQRDLDWQMALLENDQFLRDLGLRAEDKAAYYDALRRGYFSSEG